MVIERRLQMFGLSIAVVVGAIAVMSCPRLVAAQWPAILPLPDYSDAVAVAEFNRRVTDYVAMHRRLEGEVPTLQISTDMAVVRAAMDALAVRIQTERKDAQQGDIFVPGIRRVIMKCIAGCLPASEMAAVLRDLDQETPLPVPTLVVNGRWPADMPFNAVPPQLLAALPRLPSELEYRIVGRALVLWDHHADLIVDILPAALASSTVAYR